MNERIQELAEQSTIWQGMEDGYIFDKEKFAELIIRECADIGNKAYSDIGPYGYIGEKIKQHFGVEE